MAILASGQSSVGAIAEQFEMTRPAITKHLEILREAKLVRSHREGREYLNQLNAEALKPAASWLSEYSKLWDAKLDALKQAVEEDNV